MAFEFDQSSAAVENHFFSFPTLFAGRTLQALRSVEHKWVQMREQRKNKQQTSNKKETWNLFAVLSETDYRDYVIRSQINYRHRWFIVRVQRAAVRVWITKKSVFPLVNTSYRLWNHLKLAQHTQFPFSFSLFFFFEKISKFFNFSLERFRVRRVQGRENYSFRNFYRSSFALHRLRESFIITKFSLSSHSSLHRQGDTLGWATQSSRHNNYIKL